jgi:hypothetical protein
MGSDLLRTGRRGWLGFSLGIAVLIAIYGLLNVAHAADQKQSEYATPEQAVGALIAALRTDNQRDLLRILGPDGKDLVSSGDALADRAARLRLLHAYDTAHQVQTEGADHAELVVGAENWPWPIPVVKQGARWHFDTEAGAQKIIDRRIGRNELNVIEVCRAYVEAQREYASKDRMGDGLKEYATKFASSAGKHDGLYWEAAANEEQSPLGPLVAQARAEGYASGKDEVYKVPYHGYYFRILTRQGTHHPGGAKNYIVNGHMTGGFGLLAFPAKWGDSGIMTFMVDHHGVVFQKNLGPDTAKLAARITKFDPDSSWTTP